jgi:hypothetical protein
VISGYQMSLQPTAKSVVGFPPILQEEYRAAVGVQAIAKGYSTLHGPAAVKDLLGEDYCKRLDVAFQDRGIGKTTPLNWRARGCPETYMLAYHHPDPIKRKYWRNRIWDEKHKAIQGMH